MSYERRMRLRTTIRSRRTCGAFVMLVLATSAVAAESTWRLERYADPMHRGGVIVAAEQQSARHDGASVTAIVRCWSASSEVDVRFVLSDGQVFGSDEVGWRFDKQAGRTGRWRRSPDASALVV